LKNADIILVLRCRVNFYVSIYREVFAQAECQIIVANRIPYCVYNDLTIYFILFILLLILSLFDGTISGEKILSISRYR